jgi:protoporphyrinogen oxidase
MSHPEEPPRFVVIGGGITGLACALRLQQLAHDEACPSAITVIEAAPHTGGKLRTERVGTHAGEFIVDAGPDIFLANKPHGMALCEQIGFTSQLQPTNADNRTTYVRRDDTLTPEKLYADLPLVTPKEGMQAFTDAARSALVSATVLTNTRAVAIATDGARYQVTLDTGSTIAADGIIIAIPGPSTAALLRTFSPEIATLVHDVPYTAMTTVSVAYDARDVRPLEGYGYLIPNAPHGTVTACTWTSAKIAGRAPVGTVLLRGYVRGPDHDAQALVVNDIRKTLGITADPLFVRSYHWGEAVPLYDSGHSERITAVRAALNRYRGVAIAGGALDGAGIADSIRSGTTAADSVWAATTRLSSQIS